ncbi:nuclear transport factor 2 family protein [Rubellicoccus peritrichatus]|uniref:Nuclear transport factor 2 family protein n=1 Tax=Rubellicoccus peritrichatus TaxID=3080537 RepID=A0AAQ3L6G2_9BACT|nr:nuclear transport factor 2 family protein [Puniceicoccus sp. CR14]WOO39861.1 nuclear transport factor 2 family protein [Puniceicoccus sp. CR14]
MIKEDPIYALLADMTEAWNSCDLDRFMSGYAPGSDTLLLVSGKEIHGFDAIYAHYKKLFESLPEMPHLSVEILSAESNHDTARFELRFTLGSDGKSFTGLSVITLIKLDNRWLIVKDYS